jgi:hypothetical protein
MASSRPSAQLPGTAARYSSPAPIDVQKVCIKPIVLAENRRRFGAAPSALLKLPGASSGTTNTEWKPAAMVRAPEREIGCLPQLEWQPRDLPLMPSQDAPIERDTGRADRILEALVESMASASSNTFVARHSDRSLPHPPWRVAPRG